jgi:hypothetical protein
MLWCVYPCVLWLAIEASRSLPFAGVASGAGWGEVTLSWETSSTASPPGPGASGSTQSPTPPPSTWMTSHCRTPAACAWGCAPSPPSAIAGRALAVTPLGTTTLRTPVTATGSAILRKAAMITQRSAARNHWPPVLLLQLLGTLLPACTSHPQPPPGTLGLSLQPPPAAGHVLADVSFIYPLATSYIRSAARSGTYIRSAARSLCRCSLERRKAPGLFCGPQLPRILVPRCLLKNIEAV